MIENENEFDVNPTVTYKTGFDISHKTLYSIEMDRNRCDMLYICL